MRTFLGLLAVFALSLALAIVAALLLIPFWRWLEETTGIESIGHSGPAEWCYLALFALFAVAGSAIVIQRARVTRA